jgi:predicted small lipoprotein YifL
MQGNRLVNRFRDRTFIRLALVGALAATLGLAACGRKGPLDPPPGASLDGPTPARDTTLVSPVGVTPIGGGQAKSDNPGVGADGRPQASKGPDRAIFLDKLLN